MVYPGFSVIVPATTANLGPGFDSIGLALNLYMSVEVSVSDKWKVIYEDEAFQGLTTGEDNLIIETIQEIAHRYDKEIHPVTLSVQSNIPLGKGFGSSASAIAAGIVIADELLSLHLTDREKVLLGSELEGHADNVSAALLGGAVIAYFDGLEIDFLHKTDIDGKFVVLVPPNELKTTESRGILPETLTHTNAVKSSSASAVLAAAIMQNDWKIVGQMMEKDHLHEQYRKKMFPHFDEIRTKARELGAFGMTISGAGPSLIVAVKKGTEEEIANQLKVAFPYYNSFPVKASSLGAHVRINESKNKTALFEQSEK